ncbi:MAG: hypothetical protein HRU17_06740 [Polyangiaceae bacterium]|nr:hypothetical protein [Polyangiaceae bacterium]
MKARPSIEKRRKERARQDKKREKSERRSDRKVEKADRPAREDGADPDIDHIVPGPQPIEVDTSLDRYVDPLAEVNSDESGQDEKAEA